jgi:PAS domain S-box-containing protein
MSVIVVIDDRVTNRNILAKLASSLGNDVTVRAFADATSALDWSVENAPDLVITDFKMPKLDGAEFIRAFRQRPHCFDVPVVVVTVYEDREFRYRALEAGASDFLISPVDHHEFRVRVQNLLTMRRQQEIIRRRALTLEEVLNLTNKLRTEEQRQSKEVLGLVIDAVPAMVCATDAAGNVIFVNSYQCELFGKDPSTAVGMNVTELFGEDYGHRHKDFGALVLETGQPQTGIEEHLRDRSGKDRVFLTTKAPLTDAAGRVAHVVSVSLDITDRKRVERALRDAKDRADAANDTKTEFLANTSHELRTPLNAIIGFAEMMKIELLGPIGNPRYLEYANDILASAQHLLQIIDDMLDVSQIEAGKLELIEAPVDVRKLFRDVLRLMAARADEAQIELKTSLPSKLPMLDGDERKLKQILLNLLANAVRFTPPGGKVELGAQITEAGGMRMTVTDTGIGMAEQDIPIAMARFGRIHRADTYSHSGTGLGLPLAVELTKLHGGTVDITSAIGTGTCVTLHFPPSRTHRQATRA